MTFPFEVPFEQVQANLDIYVDEVFGKLRSEFLTLPRGEGFVEYPVFEQGYEILSACQKITFTSFMWTEGWCNSIHRESLPSQF
jgi:hypothetical protein